MAGPAHGPGREPRLRHGSSHGFIPALKAEIKEHLSLGPMTFPHDLSRVLFLEQLFRAFSIPKGTRYHK